MSNPADTYERYMVPVLFAPFAERLLEIAVPRSGERVLDVACGTGIVARRAAHRLGGDGTVVGIDLNPNMLIVARREATAEHLSISWEEGRAERLPFDDKRFDLTVCQQALQFFADPRAALGEMLRVLVDGGRAVLSVWQGIDQHPFYVELDRQFRQRVGMSGVGDIFAFGDANRVRSMMEEAGFRDVTVTPVSLTVRFPEPDNFLAGEIDVDAAAIPAMQKMDADERARLTATIRNDMAEILKQHTQDNHVVIPFHTNIIMGYR